MSKFEPGQSGNPNGRPVGVPNKRTRFAKLLEPHAEELVDLLISQARQGDPHALRLCIERLIPKLKSEAPTITLPLVDYTQPNALEHFRRGLFDMLAEQQEVSFDSLKLILELYAICKETEEMHKSHIGFDNRSNELMERILKEARERGELI